MAVSRIVKILFLIYLVTSVLLSPLLFVCVGGQTRSPPSVGDGKQSSCPLAFFVSFSLNFFCT